MAAAEFDLAVVGAGIVGAAAAYQAAVRRPDWRILLAERSAVGCGATRHSAGLDLPFGETPAKRFLAARSFEAWGRLAAELAPLPLRELPLYAVVGEAALEDAARGFALPGLRAADAAEERRLRRALPDLALRPGQVLLAGGRCRLGFPQAIAEALVARYRTGARRLLWEGVEIASLRGDGPYALDAADGRTVVSRRVLIATGPWLPTGPAGALARSRGVRTKKIVALHLERPARFSDPVCAFLDDGAFLLPIAERGEWLFSFTCEEWDCAPSGLLLISAADRTAALALLGRYCPALSGAATGGRVFCDAYTPDRTPLVASPSAGSGLVVAGGCSGSGYRLAPALAEDALDRLLGLEANGAPGTPEPAAPERERVRT